MVLVLLKKTLYFAMMHLYCSLRPLMNCTTSLVPSVKFLVDGFLLFSVGVFLVE